MIDPVSELETHKEVSILYYIEDGEQCWTLDLDDVDMCKRRGYPYVIVEYQNKVDAEI